MTKAAIYCRYSDSKQEDGYSIEGQVRECQKFIAEKGWQLYRVYTDEAKSGTSIKGRTAFNDMLREAESIPSPFEQVVIWKSNRFARNVVESVICKDRLQKAGVTLHSVTESFVGSDDESSLLLELISSWTNEKYSRDLAKDVMRGMTEAAKRGFWTGGHAPYGYKLIDDADEKGKLRRKLFPHHEQAPVVKRIFDLYIGGSGMRTIAIILNQEGVLNRNGKKFSHTAIDTILRNQRYCGDMVFGLKEKYGKKFKALKVDEPIIVRDSHQPLVSRDTFLAVQDLVRSKSEELPIRINETSYLLSGLLRCGKCGSAYIGTSAKSGKYFYYTCGSKIRHGSVSCESKLIPAQKIEDAIVSAIHRHIATPENLKEVAFDLLEWFLEQKAQNVVTHTHLQDEMVTLEKQKTKLFDLVDSATPDNINMLLDRVRNIDARILEIKPELDMLESKIVVQERVSEENGQQAIEKYVAAIYELFNNPENWAVVDIIRTVISEIEVGENELKIKYSLSNIPEEFLQTYDWWSVVDAIRTQLSQPRVVFVQFIWPEKKAA